MFGYINIDQPEIRFKDYYRYREYYCGLCWQLKKQYGQSVRVTLNYEMTFLALLLDGVYDSETAEHPFRCMLHPSRKNMRIENEFVSYAADMNVYFAYLKCLDDREDDHALRGSAGAAWLRRHARRVEEAYPEKTAAIREALKGLRDLEQAGSTDFEAAAHQFGLAVEQIFRYGDLWADTLGRTGFYLGKYIYLMDAYDDLEEDLKKGNYNAFASLADREDYESVVREILTSMMAQSADEFEMLPIEENMDILRNIMYSGVWNRYREIRKDRVPAQAPPADSVSHERTDK